MADEKLLARQSRGFTDRFSYSYHIAIDLRNANVQHSRHRRYPLCPCPRASGPHMARTATDAVRKIA